MKDKVAIVTASSKGIGRGITQRLLQEGCKVIISSRNKENVDQTVKELKEAGHDVIGIVCDVVKAEDRKKLISLTIEKYGKIDYFVANAGINSHVGKFTQAEDSDIRYMWELNYFATYFMIQEVLPHLKKSTHPSIVIISSILGYQYTPLLSQYSMTKLALIGMGKVLSRQLHKDKIRVNVVCPGLINTEMSQLILTEGEQKAAKLNKVHRVGTPQDVANMVKFLLSEEASYVTGESIIVAGKYYPRL